MLNVYLVVCVKKCSFALILRVRKCKLSTLSCVEKCNDLIFYVSKSMQLELFVPFYKAKKVDLHSTNPPFSLYK